MYYGLEWENKTGREKQGYTKRILIVYACGIDRKEGGTPVEIRRNKVVPVSQSERLKN